MNRPGLESRIARAITGTGARSTVSIGPWRVTQPNSPDIVALKSNGSPPAGRLRRIIQYGVRPVPATSLDRRLRLL